MTPVPDAVDPVPPAPKRYAEPVWEWKVKPVAVVGPWWIVMNLETRELLITWVDPDSGAVTVVEGWTPPHP